MNIIIQRSNIEFKLCKEIIKEHTEILNELSVILNDKDGYSYTSNSNKHKKHFPAGIPIDYNKHSNLFKNKKNLSFSLSSKPVNKQILSILNTAIRRHNMIRMFDNDIELFKNIIIQNTCNIPILSPIDLRDNLVKYSKNDIRNKYKCYDVVYLIKTENFINYVNKTNKTLCDTILICCNDKTYHIMFNTDNIINYEDVWIEKIYNDKDI